MSISKVGVRDTVALAAMHQLRAMAIEKNIPERIVKAMQLKVDCAYRASHMQTELRVAWRDPDGSDSRRSLSMLIDDDDIELRPRERVEDIIRMNLEQINLRGELFFFKLHQHFPNRIKEVKCNAAGMVTVRFNNGRELSVDESALDSTEFLATCGMIYDL